MASEKTSSKKSASRLARLIGCSGAHQNDDGVWMPCGSHEELQKISTEAETAIPKNLGKSEPPCLGCKEAKPDRDRQGNSYRKRWSKLRERGVAGIDTLEGGGLVSAPVAVKQVGHGGRRVIFENASTKALNDRQDALYGATEKIVETHGKFDQGAGPDGAHYMPADKNPFVKDGLVCSNCAYWVGPSGCEIVEGKLEPNAICKLWIIDGSRLKEQEPKRKSENDNPLAETNDNPLEEKILGAAIRRIIGRRRRGRRWTGDKPRYPDRKPKRVEPFDPQAIDGDDDGTVQDGSIHERPNPRVAARVSGGGASGQRASTRSTGNNSNTDPLLTGRTLDLPPTLIDTATGQIVMEPAPAARDFYKNRARALKRLYDKFSPNQQGAMLDRSKKLRNYVKSKYNLNVDTTLAEAKKTLQSVFPNLDLSLWTIGKDDDALGAHNLGSVVGLLTAAEIMRKKNPEVLKMITELRPVDRGLYGVDGGADFNFLPSAGATYAPLSGVSEPNKTGKIEFSIMLADGSHPNQREFEIKWSRWKSRYLTDRRKEEAHWRIGDRIVSFIAGAPDGDKEEARELEAFSCAMHEMGHIAHYWASVKDISLMGVTSEGMEPIDENTDFVDWVRRYSEASGFGETLQDWMDTYFDNLFDQISVLDVATQKQIKRDLGMTDGRNDRQAWRNHFFNYLRDNPIFHMRAVWDDLFLNATRGLHTSDEDRMAEVERFFAQLSGYAMHTTFSNGAMIEGPSELFSYLGLGGTLDSTNPITSAEVPEVLKMLEYLGVDLSDLERMINEK